MSVRRSSRLRAKEEERGAKSRSRLLNQPRGLSSSSSDGEGRDQSDIEGDEGRNIVVVTPSRRKKTPQKPNNYTKV